MTMSVLLGLGGQPQRAGERGGRDAATGADEAFGQLVGKSDKQKGGEERLARDDEPRGERLGTGRKFVNMFDLEFRRVRHEMETPAVPEPAHARDASTIEDEPQADGAQSTGTMQADNGLTDADGTKMSVSADPEITGTMPVELSAKAGVGAVAAETKDDGASPGALAVSATGDKPVGAREATPAPKTVDAATADSLDNAGDGTSTAKSAKDAEMQSRVTPTVQRDLSAARDQRSARNADAARAPAAGVSPDTPARAEVETATGRRARIDDHVEATRRLPTPPTASSTGEGAHGRATTQPAAQTDGTAGQAPATRSGEPAANPFADRVKVLPSNVQASPPPPALVSLLGSTSASVVAAIEADPAWRAAATETASTSAVRTPNSGSGVNSLRIQLHPVELGMVTARLTTSGSQLSIEIQVESNDARQRLSNDADAIVKALRSVGLDVDKITIQQSAPTSNAANQSGTGPRDQQMPGQQMQGDGNGRDRGDRQAGNQDRDQTRSTVAERGIGRAGDGIYI